ncbi:hypothetical protein [Streptomyces sp. NPDC048527]|uniref:hypothetical protein n=1 Tax=Streptomyces sp. NPDC048527 TaxID=3365568 RepID=UPI003710DBE7
MADMTAILSLVSGLGGALAGAVAGVYGPRSIDKRRRAHEWALEQQRLEVAERTRVAEAQERERLAAAEVQQREREEAAAERMREREEAAAERVRAWRAREEAEERQRLAVEAESEKALNAIVEATVLIQDWQRRITWALQNISAGRSVDLARFDGGTEQSLRSVVRAVSLLSNRPFMTAPRIDSGEARLPVTSVMQQVTAALRAQIVAPRDDFDAAAMDATATQIRDDLMQTFSMERSARIGPGFHVGPHLRGEMRTGW